MATKSGTSAERVVWMTRTSDVLGSHLKTDLDSYLALIRRKIQEKCATTVELITQIRRFKVGESGHVTPNEFRYTLIKFGIILPQPLVDRIFAVFDSDRSGTMDFDEFAMWIMNSEFRPALEGDEAPPPKTASNDNLLKKLQVCVSQQKKAFENMKEQISFLQFVSDIHRLKMPLTDREARSIFLCLDPKDTGFISSWSLRKWAETGKIDLNPPKKQAPKIQARSLEELITKVIGRNSRQLESSFSHIQRGQGIKLPFEEFRRCLLNAGVGKNVHNCHQLFLALGGEGKGEADIDLFFQKLGPIMEDPTTKVSLKPEASSDISTSRADRRLRDALRKSYKLVKADIEAVDVSASGYIEAEALYRILVKRVSPLTYPDFRFIVQQIKKEPGSTRIDYHHFLHGYNPSYAPHILEGSATLKDYDLAGITNSLQVPLPSKHPVVPNHNLTTEHKSSIQIKKDLERTKYLQQTNQLDKILNHTAPAAFSVDTTGNNDKSLKFTKSKTLGSVPRDDIDLPSQTYMGGSSNLELRRIWQAVLRECHRADPGRAGQVNKNVFIAALEKCDRKQTLSPETKSKLADNYTMSNGLVNYLHLFRSYLSDRTGLSKSASPPRLSP